MKKKIILGLTALAALYAYTGTVAYIAYRAGIDDARPDPDEAHILGYEPQPVEAEGIYEGE